MLRKSSINQRIIYIQNCPQGTQLHQFVYICIQIFANIHDITEVKQTNINLPVGYERNVNGFVIVVICAPDEVISVSY